MIAGTDVDLFTEVLRYVVWIVLLFLFMAVVGALTWTAFIRWRRKRRLRLRRSIYDWEIDGGIETEDMYPRTHVSVPDGVPKEWWNEWR